MNTFNLRQRLTLSLFGFDSDHVEQRRELAFALLGVTSEVDKFLILQIVDDWGVTDEKTIHTVDANGGIKTSGIIQRENALFAI